MEHKTYAPKMTCNSSIHIGQPCSMQAGGYVQHVNECNLQYKVYSITGISVRSERNMSYLSCLITLTPYACMQP